MCLFKKAKGHERVAVCSSLLECRDIEGSLIDCETGVSGRWMSEQRDIVGGSVSLTFLCHWLLSTSASKQTSEIDLVSKCSATMTSFR